MAKIFVTGGTGFVGRRLVERLAAASHEVVVLSRNPSRGTSRPPVQYVRGDLVAASTYAAPLAGTDAVVHLAAATGAAAAREHRRTNVRGTSALVAACQEAGVRRFIQVSSVAAAFPDAGRYPYARSKAEAETAVRSAGLDAVIFRPTIILGRGSPILRALCRLAALPIVPVPGPGRALVQPVHVDDVTEALLALLEPGLHSGETLAFGGPDVLTIEALLDELRYAMGRARARKVHVPLGLLEWPLRLIEAVADGLLPVTAGQLSSFRYDGTASANAFLSARRDRLLSVPAMLRISLGS